METRSESQLAADRAIALLGGPVKAAVTLNVPKHRYQTVQSWLRNRVPTEYCPLIERATLALGDVVRCEQLRPDVEWGVVRGQSLTPA